MSKTTNKFSPEVRARAVRDGLGPRGISSVFFLSPINDDNFGPVTIIVNDGEKLGVIRIDIDLLRGQRSDPFHAALAAGSPLLPCKSAAPSAALVVPKKSVAANVNSGMATPASWTNLPTLMGRDPGSRDRNNIDLISTGPIADAIVVQFPAQGPCSAGNLQLQRLIGMP